MYPFTRLNVWAKAHELTVRTYRLTDGPVTRRYPGLSSQLRRAISAIPANIAEGAGHTSQAQFSRYLAIAIASSHEAMYHLLLAKDLEAITATDYAFLEARLKEVQAKLVLLRKRVVQNAKEQAKENEKRGGRMASPLSSFNLHRTTTPRTKAPARG
jgi:four helix bundle protein